MISNRSCRPGDTTSLSPVYTSLKWIFFHLVCWDPVPKRGISTVPMSKISTLGNLCYFSDDNLKEMTGNMLLKHVKYYIVGILPKGPYLPCVSMAGRALLAGYPRYTYFGGLKIWILITGLNIVVSYLTSNALCIKYIITYMGRWIGFHTFHKVSWIKMSSCCFSLKANDHTYSYWVPSGWIGWTL